MAVFVRGNLFAQFQPPFCQADAITNGGVKFAIVAQGENRRGRVGGAIVAEKRQAQSVVAAVLINLQAENDGRLFMAARSSGPPVRRSKNRQSEWLRNSSMQAVERRLDSGAIRRGALVAGHDVAEPRVQFKVAEMSARVDDAARRQQAFTRQCIRRAGAIRRSSWRRF